MEIDVHADTFIPGKVDIHYCTLTSMFPKKFFHGLCMNNKTLHSIGTGQLFAETHSPLRADNEGRFNLSLGYFN